MITATTKQPDGTIKLTITIPTKDIDATREKILEQYAAAAQLPGFRKGKAPKKLVEKKVDPEKIREEILRELLPKTYSDALKENGIKPIINPRINVAKLEQGQDWQFDAYTCELPEIKLGDYKNSITKLTVKNKIIIPGKEETKTPFDEILKIMLENVTATIPQILVDEEVDRQLSQMLGDIKKLGLTLDQYLASTGKTPEDLRKEYGQKAQNDIKFEFALQKIAEEEKITVDEKEIDNAINKAKDEAERKNLQENRYLLANILRQQKTLDFLRNL